MIMNILLLEFLLVLICRQLRLLIMTITLYQQIGHNIYKSMLRGKQTFKDLIYASPHINYRSKTYFLSQIHEYDDPVFLQPYLLSRTH